jgi:hypothetical protein
MERPLDKRMCCTKTKFESKLSHKQEKPSSLLVLVLCHVILKFLVFNLTIIHLTINVISRQMTNILKEIKLSYMVSMHTYLEKIIIR